MPERPSGSDRADRLSSTVPRPAFRRLRVLSSGRWRPPAELEKPILEESARLIAVSSALPGQGKSVVASNIAAAIAGLGREVLLVDLDGRSPRQHALLGLPAPTTGMAAWLESRRQQVDGAHTVTKVRNLRLLPCQVQGDDRALRLGLVRELHQGDAHVIVVDIGSDNQADLFDGFATGAHRVLVTGLDAAALEATYALLATVVARAERRHGRSAQAVLGRFRGGLIGNRAASAVETETLHAFARLVRARLNLHLPVMACFEASARIPESMDARQPLVTRRALDQNVRAFHQLAELLLADDAPAGHDCALDVDEPIALKPGPLPVALADFERKHPRFPVDWVGTVEFPAGSAAVRVRDVSESGVGIETTLPLRMGDSGRLQLSQLPGAPVIAVQVKNLLPSLRRAGLGFVKPDRQTARITSAARRGR
jgi:MinD-like ATPase involved in chromosome partitioning or flagellar assembly